MSSLYLINKRFVDIDMSCDEYLKAQEDFLFENRTEEKLDLKDSDDVELSVFEDLDLSLISLKEINEIVYEEMTKSTNTYVQKALNAYNISTYKTSLKPSLIIRNFEREQE